MIISFSGNPGAGKSTIAKMLAEKLNWPRYYIGAIRRQKAAKHGMTLAEYNQFGESDPTTDEEVDEYQKNLGATKDNFIIEGRTSWYFIPHSFKIFLAVSREEGAKRVFKQLQSSQKRNEDHGLNDITAVIKSHQARKISDDLRYKQYFNINVYDQKNYDLVIDTTHTSIKEIFDKISAIITKKLQKSD